MGKKKVGKSNRTPPKKIGKKTIEVSSKAKVKEAMSKGKAKVKFASPVVEESADEEAEESVENDVSDEISEEEIEESAEGESSGDEEESSDEKDEESGDDDEDNTNLDDVVKMATELGSKKKGKKQEKVLEDNLDDVVDLASELGSKKKGKKQEKVLEGEGKGKSSAKAMKVDGKHGKVGGVKKTLEVGQSSKRKAPEKEVVRKRQRKEGTKTKVVDGHGSPASLHDAIQCLSAAQRKDVEDIGFGGLLELKASKFIHTMIDWLLERYDTVTRLFLFNRMVHFAVSRHDVHDVFMLPCEGTSVPAVSEDKELLHFWREKFHVLPKGDIPLDQVKIEMLKLVKGGSDFKKLFVVFAMGSFLDPTVHNRVDVRLLGAVEDVAAIPNMDWCTYILDRFDKAVNSWKKHNTKSMGGCLMFFQLIYFHRLIWRGEPTPSTLPLIKHWSDDLIKARFKEECNAYIVHGGFGIGVWDISTYPVSLHQKKSLYRQTPPTVSTALEVVVQEPNRPAEETSGSKENAPRCLTFPLPDDLLTDEELRKLYKDDRVLKWYTTKRNQNLVSRLHHQMAAEMEQNFTASEGVPVEQEANVGDAQPSQETLSQLLNKDAVFYAEFMAMLESADKAMENVVLPPSFDLGIDFTGIGHQPRPTRSYELRYSRARDPPQPQPKPVLPVAKDVSRSSKAAKKK